MLSSLKAWSFRNGEIIVATILEDLNPSLIISWVEQNQPTECYRDLMDVTLADEKLLMLVLMMIMLWMSACKRFVQIEHLIEKALNIEVHCGA